MKFKYLSMALAAVALASCSSDDLKLADGTTMTLPEDGSKIFATIVEPDGGDLTRAGFATQINYNEDGSQKSISQMAMFQEGDEFKMYCTHTWKPQTYKFVQDAEIDGVNGSLFEFADADSKLNDGADLSTREYGVYPADKFSFIDENRSNLYFQLPAMNVYEVDGGYYKATSTSIEGVTNRKVYSALIPLFGFNVENKVSFNYMTSLIRVQLQGVPEGVHQIKLSQNSGTQKLSGVFASTEFDATEGASAKLPVFNTETTTTAAEQTIAVQFETDGSQSDYIIYLPLPTGTYDLTDLRLVYTPDITTPAVTTGLDMTLVSGDYAGGKITSTGTATPVDSWAAAKKTAFTGTDAIAFELGTGTRMVASFSGPEEATATNLLKINSLLKKYADFGREANVNLTLAGNIAIPSADALEQVEQNKKLIIPTLKNNVTLNIKGGSFTTNNLIIEDAGAAGTGKLTINLIADKATVDANVTSTKIVSTSAQALEIKTTDDTANSLTAKISGASFGNKTTDLTLNATFTAAVDIAAATKITIAKDLGTAIDAGTANVEIKDNITYSVTAKGGNVTVDADGKTIAALRLTKAATTKLDGEADVLIKAGTVTALTLGTNETTSKGITTKVKMVGGKITALQGTIGDTEKKFADGTALTVASEGAAEIGEIKALNDDTKSSIAISATYNKATKDAAATTSQANIYTAVQLKDANEATTNLLADITIASDFESKTNNGSIATFNGNNHTISGLTAPLFAAVESALTVKDLKLVAAINNGKDSGINGALAGTVGKSSGSGFAVKVENCHVSGTIKGYYYTGGFVGKVIKNGQLTFGYKATDATDEEVAKQTAAKCTSDVTFTNTKTYGVVGWDVNAGTWGQYVGSVADDGTVTIVENCTGNTKFDKKALNFTKQRLNDGAGTINGYFKGNTDLIGFTTTTGDLTYGGKTYKAGLAGTVSLVGTTKTIADVTFYTTDVYRDLTYTGYIGTTALNTSAQSTIKTNNGTILTEVVGKYTWTGVTVNSHNLFVAAEY